LKNTSKVHPDGPLLKNGSEMVGALGE